MKLKAFLLLVLFTFACTHAPVASRAVGGIIVHEGAPLPGVVVTLKASGQPERTTTTDANGRYQFAGVAPGEYVVRARLEGFNGVDTRVSVSARKDVALQTAMRVAAIAENITVTAHAPFILDAIQETTILTRMNGAVTREYGNYVGGVQLPVEKGPPVEHAFVETARQNVATFAIDVDRASYSRVRNYVAHGMKPPAQMVRIEELVNYFDYDYPQPKDGGPFSITTEVAGCPWNPGNRLLRVGIQGREVKRDHMAPNNLVFLIDVSGSMDAPAKLPLVVHGLSVLVDELRAEDRVSIVVYAGAAGVVLPPTSGADKEAIRAALARLSAGGSTAGGEGIERAYQLAKEHFLEDGNNRVILATDGDFNVGVSSVEELEQVIEEKRRSGVFLTVLGVGGGNERDDVMEALADKGNGNYAFFDSEHEVEKVFRRELTGTLVTIAKDVKVQLDFDPRLVLSYRQIGYENRALAAEDFADDAKDAGELGAGHSVTALFELVPAPGARGRIGTLRLRYKDPRGEASQPLTTEVVDGGKGAYDASPDMQFAAAVAELGMLLRDSPHKGTATWDDVLALARISVGPDLEGERREFVTMAETARGLR